MGNAWKINASSPFEVEAHTIKEGLFLGSLMDQIPIIIKSNAKFLVQSINTTHLRPSWKLQHLILNLKIALRSSPQSSLVFAPYSCHKAIDWLAKAFKKGVCALNWVLRPPPLFSPSFFLMFLCFPLNPHSFCFPLFYFYFLLVLFFLFSPLYWIAQKKEERLLPTKKKRKVQRKEVRQKDTCIQIGQN